jgi:CBS domain-containing protein
MGLDRPTEETLDAIDQLARSVLAALLVLAACGERSPPLEVTVSPVRALMSTPVAWVEPNVSLIDLATTFETAAVSAVPVMSGDHLDGVVSERDIVRLLSSGCDPSDVASEAPLKGA